MSLKINQPAYQRRLFFCYDTGDKKGIKPLISTHCKCLTLFLFSIEWPVRIYEIEAKASHAVSLNHSMI